MDKSIFAWKLKPQMRALSRLGLCLVLILIWGSLQPGRAQSIGVSTLTLPQGVNDIVWDGTRSRFFASSGTTVLMINPETAQVEDTIDVWSPANRIAVSGDGQYLYVALGNGSFDSLGIVNRYQIQNHSLAARGSSLEFEIAVSEYSRCDLSIPADLRADSGFQNLPEALNNSN